MSLNTVIFLGVIGGILTFYLISRRGKPSGRQQELFTYEEAIDYLVNNEPPVPFAKAAIIREVQPRKTYKVTLVYLDENEEIVTDQRGKAYGRTVQAKALDRELLDAFGRTNLIVVN